MKKLYAVATMAVLLCLAGFVMPVTTFAQQCVDNGDGTVTDNSTGLMWQKATAGPMNWNTAMNYASSLSLGGHSGWRLPSRDELHGLYRSPCTNMMNVESSRYWSSTTSASYRTVAWLIKFYNGHMDTCNKSSTYYVRAVRAGQ